MATVAGKIKRGSTIVVAKIDIGTILQQQTSTLQVTVETGKMKWGSTIAIGEIDIGAILQQQTGTFQVTFLAGNEAESTIVSEIGTINTIFPDSRRATPNDLFGRPDEAGSGICYWQD